MENIFGCGKNEKYVSFPYDWILPGELKYKATGFEVAEDSPLTYKEAVILATKRRNEGLNPIFWMENVV